MTDRVFEPPSVNPFDQLADEAGLTAPKKGAQQQASESGDDTENPFTKIWNEPSVPRSPQTSAKGAFLHAAERGVAPSIGGFAGAIPGAEAGMAAGAPLAPFTGGLSVPVGGLIGGVAGAFGGSWLTSKAQDWALSKLPDSWREALGQDDRQQQLEESQHPTASFVGGITPFVLTMRPGSIPTKALPENSTALERLMAHPVTARLFGGAAMGGMELGQEAVHGQVDWQNVAIATGFGLVLNKPTKFGQAIAEQAARPTQALFGNPRHEPTVIQAADAKVMGPGITEEVFHGAHEQDPSAAMTAQEAARAERTAMGEPGPEPDLHALARRADPDTLDAYDELLARRDTFRTWLDIAPESSIARDHLASTEKEIADLSPAVAAAYRRVAEATGAPMHEPASVPELYPLGHRPAAQPAQINTKHDVKSGAVASKEPNGPVYIDPHIPEFSPVLKDKDGNPANLHKYLAVHEQEERAAMAAGMPYDQAHTTRATPAERAAVEADGVDWKRYTEEMDGYLDKVEHETVHNPPPDPHVSPDAAVGDQHHHSENKAGIEAARPVEAQRKTIADDIARQLMAAGRPKEEADAAAQVAAHYYATRAARFKGALGTAEELYAREGAQIRGPRQAPPSPSEPPPRAVLPPAVRGPRARPEETWSLLEFLASRGGIDPNDRLAPDLRMVFGTNNKFIPGFGNLIRTGGLSLDRAREAAVEAGYMRDTPYEGGVQTTTIRDLLDVINDEARGQKRYREGYQPEAKPEDAGERAHRMESTLDAALESVEIPASSVIGPLRERVLQIMEKEGVHDPLEAYERASQEDAQRDIDAGIVEHIPEHIPGWDVPADAESASAAGGALPEGEHATEGGTPRPTGEGNRETPEVGLTDRARKIAADALLAADKVGLTDPDSAWVPVYEAGKLLFQVPHLNISDDGVKIHIEPDGLVIPAWGKNLSWGLTVYRGIIKGEQRIYVRDARLPEDMRGLGVGVAMYERAAQMAAEEGLPFTSDGTVTVDAARVWGALKQLGYEVNKNPNAVFRAGPKEARDAGLNLDRYETEDGSPVFRIGLDQNGKLLFQEQEPAPTFYSAVERTIANAKQEKASPDQWLGMLKNAPGVKSEEMEWLGLNDWLKEQKGQVTKQAIADYIRANQIEVKEVEKGGPVDYTGWTARENASGSAWEVLDQDGRRRSTIFRADADTPEQAVQAALNEARRIGTTLANDVKFSGYQLPGGENYRELLLTLPESERIDQAALIAKSDAYEQARQRLGFHAPETARLYRELLDAQKDHFGENAFRGSHWDEPNVLAHVRFNDRTIDGKKTLFVEEVQSDWHQKGRKQGYKDGLSPERRSDLEAERKRIWDAHDHDIGFLDRHPEESARLTEIERQLGNLGAVPDAPFKTTWPELTLKRMIRYAVENGYEQIAWTPGEVQAARYDLSKHVKEIEYVKNHDGTYSLGVTDINGNGVHMPKERMTLNEVEDTVGKEIAEKISNGDGRKYRGHDGYTLEGLDLKVGGEGMKSFYDRELVNVANKLTKKFGGKVGRSEIKTLDQTDRDVPFTVRDRDGVVVETDIQDENWAAQRAREIGGSYGFDETAGETKTHSVHTLPITPELRKVAVEQGFPLFQRAARGKIQLNPDRVPGRDYLGVEGTRPILTMMRDANASTFIHESGHQWLADLMRDSVHPAAPDDLKADAQTTLKWLGVEKPEDIKTKQHEKFARGFEQYLREGTAPSPELANVFARFKNWLLSIYQTLKGLGSPISEDIRGVFDRMLAAEPQRTVIAPDRLGGPSFHDIHEADAAHTERVEAPIAADRVAAEAARFIQEPPADIAHEIAPALSEIEAAAAARTAGEPAGETGAGTGQPGQVDSGRQPSEPVAESGGVGGGGSEVVQGRTGPAAEGAGTSGGQAAGADQRRNAEQGSRAQPLAPRPATLFGPEQSPFLDKAGNIRVENLTTNADVAQAIHDAARENDDFIGDRRGVVTDGQVMDLADALGMDFDKLNTRQIGQAFNAEQVMAARKLLVQSATEVSAAMKKAAIGTDEDVMAYAMAKDRHQMIQAHVAGITAEAGRALRAFRNIAGQETEGVDQFIRSATGKTLFQLRQEAKLGATLDTPQQVSKFMQDAQKRSFGRMLLEYFVNNLISGPATHVTYVIGTQLLTAEKLFLITPVAAAIGKVKTAFGYEGNVVHLGEVRAGLRGYASGVAPMIKGVEQALRTGKNVELPGEQNQAPLPFQLHDGMAPAEVADMTATYRDAIGSYYSLMRGMRDAFVTAGALVKAGGVEGAPRVGLRYSHLGMIPDVQIKGVTALPLGSVIRGPSRMVAAIHTLHRVTNYSMEKSVLDYRMAANEGHTGDALAARVAELRLSDVNTERAAKSATDLSLMGQGGKFMQRLSGWLSVAPDLPVLGETPFLKFIDPFVQISGQVMKHSVGTHSPLGFASQEVRADISGRNGGAAQDMAIAKMLVGSALGITLGGIAAEAYLSGSGPTDRNLAAAWRQAGWRPHSVRIGDLWYDVHKLGPLGLLASVAADMHDVAHAAKTEDMQKAAALFMHAVTHNFMEEGFMRGPADLIKAIEDSGRYGESYVRNFLSSFVPYSVGLGQTARAVDPYSRQARSIMDGIKAKIPGLSETLWPRIDTWGEPMPNPDALVMKGATAIYESKISHDPVNIALMQLGIGIAPPPRKIRNVQLTDDQYDDFSRIAGRMLKMRLDTIVKSPNWQTWPDHIKRDTIQAQTRAVRETAVGMMLMKYPQIPRDATEAKRKKLLN